MRLFDHGRPARVQLLVLIDRGHRELPIEARFVGRMVQTSDIEIIEVKFQEIDGMEKVLLVERSAQRSEKWKNNRVPLRCARCLEVDAGRIAGNRRAGSRRDRSHPGPRQAFSAAPDQSARSSIRCAGR
jgi:hypothetical protein